MGYEFTGKIDKVKVEGEGYIMTFKGNKTMVWTLGVEDVPNIISDVLGFRVKHLGLLDQDTLDKLSGKAITIAIKK